MLGLTTARVLLNDHSTEKSLTITEDQSLSGRPSSSFLANNQAGMIASYELRAFSYLRTYCTMESEDMAESTML